MDRIMEQNCAINEQTGDGKTVGRCCFYVGDTGFCPRHGDVRQVQDHYKKTGKLTLESEFMNSPILGVRAPVLARELRGLVKIAKNDREFFASVFWPRKKEILLNQALRYDAYPEVETALRVIESGFTP